MAKIRNASYQTEKTVLHPRPLYSLFITTQLKCNMLYALPAAHDDNLQFGVLFATTITLDACMNETNGATVRLLHNFLLYQPY